MARSTALIYNWWSLVTRLAISDRHTEGHQPSAAAAWHRAPDPAR